MIHRVSQKKLSRDTGARRLLLKNLAADLILHEKIVTTKVRAKALRPVVEKLITRAKQDSLANRRYLVARLKRENAVRKLFELIGPTFKERPGGYLRIIKLPARAGDNTQMAAIEFVERVSEMAARKKLEEKATEERNWYIVDVKNKVLGRIATRVAILLMGKNKPTWQPNLDTGDNVIITNAAKIA